MTEHFDLAIIGSGSGNSLVTHDFDDARVAVIEGGTFGGTCLNVGCIPSKMLVYAADVVGHVRDAARYGVDATLDGVRWRDIRDRVFGRIDPISEGGKRYRIEGANTTAFLGHARFTGDRRLAVDLGDKGTRIITAEQIVVATGSHPVIPDVVRRSGVVVHTSDTIMRVDEVPRHLAILGGGFIAAEMAHIFSSFGARVTILARGERLLRHHDDDISTRFTDAAREQWDVRTGTRVVGVGPQGTGGGPHGTRGEPEGEQHGTFGTGVCLQLDSGDAVEADALLVATGRVPNTSDLGVEAGGIRLHPDGRVVADEYGRTTAPGVWTLGDVSSPYQLKHVANAEARVVAHNLVHPDDLVELPHTTVPAAVFSHPQVAAVGLTEQQCVEQGLRYVTYVQRYGDTAYGWAMEDTTSVCKVIADPATGRLLGAHILGPQASSLIQPLVQAMAFGTPARDVARGQYWIHPALAEVVENAVLGLDLDAAAGGRGELVTPG